MLTRSDAEAQLTAFRSLTPREQGIEVAEQLAFLAKQGVLRALSTEARCSTARESMEPYADA